MRSMEVTDEWALSVYACGGQCHDKKHWKVRLMKTMYFQNDLNGK